MDVTGTKHHAAPELVDARRPGVATVSWSQAGDRLRCVVGWQAARPALADVLPLFDQLGLRLLEHQQGAGSDDVFTLAAALAFDDEAMDLLGEAFLAAWNRSCDRDEFAALTAVAHLHPRQVQLVRVAFAYLRQAGLGASRHYVRDILLAHPAFVSGWIEAFESRFDPTSPGTSDRLDALLEEATTADEDKVLRWFTGFVRAITRTTYFQGVDLSRSATIVVKLDPSRMAFLPGPPAKVETFVHHPDVEGLHVRNGLIARGGLRCSDRLEDYRTEVLALVRAQQVKNSLIVPAGAKGAFVVKVPLADLDPEAAELQLRRCYRLFVRGLLDITDNVVAGEVRHPAGTVALDAADPYLVVAADKGTAALSDLANAEAAETGFWLGDAFASGGSTGYDHKALGVTARGAWVSVRRHLAELGQDVDTNPFTVVGIGDMSGDVFGNGMLMSTKIRLVAAFDHRHVFLDPDPDPARSFSERQRLARLPRSSWADYSLDVISPGGGVYPRTARTVALSAQVRDRLDLAAAELTPDELVRAVLTAPVDLLWNGGIGTYVRASHETDADAGDRTNDRVRVRADHLRCRAVGEGGNLGLTQAARIEYSLRGGRVNADFIDNAGGVNTSDREVNLKILLNPLVASGTLDIAGRNELLAECAHAIVQDVMEDNQRQTWAIGVAEAHGPFLLDRHERVMRSFEEVAGLDRSSAQLPSDEEVERRRAEGRGLTRPEIALLLAHAKNVLATQLEASDVPDDAAVVKVLLDYFPALVRTRFEAEIREHPLARQIISTRLAGEVMDRLGPGFLYRLEDRTGAAPDECLRGYLVAWDLLGLESVWQGLDTLRLQVTTPVRWAVERTLDHNACWFVRRADRLTAANARSELGPHIQRLREWLEASHERILMTTVTELVAHGSNQDVARRAAAATRLFPAFDLAAEASETGEDVVELAQSWFEIRTHLGLDWLIEALPIVPGDSHVAQLAKAALGDDLCAVQVQLAADALRSGGCAGWASANQNALRRVRALADDLTAHGEQGAVADMAALALGVELMRDLVTPA